jgi:hypothetical protein
VNNEVLYNLYFSPNIIRMFKSKRMLWTGHVACMGNVRQENLKERVYSKDRRWEGNIRTDLKQGVCDCLDCIHVTQVRDQCPGYSGYDNEPSDSIKYCHE